MKMSEELRSVKREELIIGVLAYALSLVNMYICWYNFTMTRLASMFITKYYISTIYEKLEKKSELTMIGGITQLHDIITIFTTILLCLIFIYWLWHRYELAAGKSGSLFIQTFSTMTGFQLLEVALAGLIMLVFNFLLVDGKMDLMQPMLNLYSQEIFISAACLVLGIAGVVTGIFLRRRVNHS